MDIDRALSEITSSDFAEWQAFHQLEPFGDEWRQTARLVVAALAPHATKGTRLEEEDFMPIPKRKQTEEEIESALRAWANQHNARLGL